MKKFPLAFLLISFLLMALPSPAQEQTDALLAAQYFREGDYEKAAALYEGLMEEDPDPVAYTNYLESLFYLEDYRKAERLVRRRMREQPDAVGFEVDLGWVFDRAGNARRMQRQFDDVMNGMQADPRRVVAQAEAFESRGYPDLAIETYLRGRRLLGKNVPLHLQLAALYGRKGKLEDMMNEYIDYVEAVPSATEQVRGILQDAITDDPDFSRNEALRQVLLSRTQQNPNNALYSEMLLWLSLQQKDFRIALMQARALDRRLRQEGELVLEVAQLAATNEDFDIAEQAFQYLLDKGPDNVHYMDALTGFLDVRFRKVTSSYGYSREDLQAVERDFEEALEKLGTQAETVKMIRNLANLQAFYLGKTDTAIELLNNTLNLPDVSRRIKAECRIELADILLLSGQVWDATLLYSEVDKTFRDDPLAHEAKFKNARLSFYIGEFDWAKAQLDILKAGTSRLIANDAMQLSLRIQDNVGFDGNTRPLQMYARAEMLSFMNRFEEALEVLDSIGRMFPAHDINDDVLFARAQIMLTRGQYEQADELLGRIVEAYPEGLLADEALFKRAELQERVFNKPEEAMALYQQLLNSYPGSLNAVAARNRFRALRDGIVN
ncbi:MAG: tetratricopeptide repeat protein [Bacteroidales bacterium]|jgi:tetratricopeptide (TPR) repeat protein|nr:tetratricopeptide repeat protein [Bacteroidales bacterium]NLM91595.1 tetratricopeptide repeat protein [Bacteroidales bacterium]